MTGNAIPATTERAAHPAFGHPLPEGVMIYLQSEIKALLEKVPAGADEGVATERLLLHATGNSFYLSSVILCEPLWSSS